ncbi:MAG: phosphoribosylaminoimidazole-succinocarboxamide synthase [Thermococcaceae archaeon]|jgi:phosphoribosylaminoimidazole-succinocarboxamide synthase|uniref:phosphoribosylaminoimidazolesuccinocarboxamide synthase n=1 Tax=Thermococcus TaxID=2263 RepID=UPI00074827AD|nr:MULTISPECIES: phosphoribosylaminoimidazolesuccinocarboxamide synthase [Thermococcus]KUJ99037.1 MAG: Phosphoribosylaminoimidazolesuccinocarboxamide synthase [Thermococcales archaeon 44_46]MDK2982735.1 phosphoribosylaminoimidazole-succinocarboxamide synthase [Thermococcaceae archaeon]MCA6213474.1 phosphoribosylaminoimidazolesuccinocarboxamide synthase [Thermococcus bergensis]MDN5319758.1 phosphoribosylaminoimidazole-succinocarboxamide synthase [Thermococcaceae archaeon]MPW38512.1 phosphoribos
MKLIYRGKTKDVYEDGEFLIFYFKDSILGFGEKEDTGGNEVIGGRKGKGSVVLKQTEFFFKLLEKRGVKTHFVERLDERRAKFLKAERIPLEVIYRYKAYGSFLRRYGELVKPLSDLDIVEFTLKSDALGDPLICEEVTETLGIATKEEIEEMKKTTRKVAQILKEFFKSKGFEIIDFKLEFGRKNDELLVIDEISGDTIRVMKGGKLLKQEELLGVIE